MLDVQFRTRKRREGNGKEENIREQLKWNESSEERGEQWAGMGENKNISLLYFTLQEDKCVLFG